MLSKLAEIAQALDRSGYYNLASQIDHIIEASSVDTGEAIKSWMKRLRQKDVDSDTKEVSEENLEDAEDPVGKHEIEIATRHQIELDKQHLLQDLSVEIEGMLPEKVLSRVDNSHKLISPHIKMNLDGATIMLVLQEVDQQENFILVAYVGDPANPNILKFPLSIKKPVGSSWVSTVATTIANKLQDDTR